MLSGRYVNATGVGEEREAYSEAKMMLSWTAEQYDFIRQLEPYKAQINKLLEELGGLYDVSEFLQSPSEIRNVILGVYQQYYKNLKGSSNFLSEHYGFTKEEEIKNIEKEIECIKRHIPNVITSDTSDLQYFNISSILITFKESLPCNLGNSIVVSSSGGMDLDFHSKMGKLLKILAECKEISTPLKNQDKILAECEGISTQNRKLSDIYKLSFKEKLRFYGVLPVKYSLKNKKNKTALVIAVVLGIGMFFDAVLSGVNMTNFKSVKSFKDLIPNHLGMVAFWALALLTLSFVFKVIATGRSGMVFNEEFVRVNPEAVRVNPGIKGGNELVLGDSKAHGNPLICDADYMPR